MVLLSGWYCVAVPCILFAVSLLCIFVLFLAVILSLRNPLMVCSKGDVVNVVIHSLCEANILH